MNRISRALPLLLIVGGCVTAEDSYEARRRASEEQMVASAQQFADKLKADSEAQIADYDRRLETWKPQLREYFSCNRNASQVVAAQPGEPTSLAVAARNICREAEASLQKAIYAAHSDNPKFGTDALEKMRKKALENNTGDIVADRIKAGAAPAQTRPSAPPPVDRRI